jgi:tetratricopeptide (TPR) repeat protein
MQIIHKIDDFLYTIFPSVKKGKQESLVKSIEEYYTYGNFKPTVTIEDGWIKIEIDALKIISQESDYNKVTSLCEKGKYTEAKPILKSLIEKNPSNSEYHRIMGQILSDEGNQEEAINCLIDALRWDSKNAWALVMMGNIFAKYKNDIPTAMKYYDQALIVNPNDNITINNIGGNLLMQDKIEEAKKYFWEALRINDKYPNTHFALGMIAEMEGDLHSAFYSSIQAVKNNHNKDGLYQNSVQLVFDIAKKGVATDYCCPVKKENRDIALLNVNKNRASLISNKK